MRKSYPAYKESGIEWMGKIPIEWKIKKIKYLYRIIGGNGFNESLQGQESGDYPFCKVSDINHSGIFIEAAKNFVSQEEVSINKYNIIPTGSLIFAKIGEALKKNHRKINKVECIIDNNTQALIQNKKMDTIFSYYLFLCIDMNWFDNGGTIPCISNQQLLSFSIPDISIDEQKRIAYYLDYKTRLIDDLIEKTNQKIELLKEKRTSLINHCVTKGLNPDVEMKDSGVEWIGKIPKHWELIKLKYLLVSNNGIKIGPFGSDLKLDTLSDTGIKIYGQNNIINNNFFIGHRYLSNERFNSEFTQYKILPGDILITMMGTTGKSVVFPIDAETAILDSHLLRLRIKESESISILISLLINNADYIKNQVKYLSRGSIMEGLNSEIIKSLQIIKPPLIEQNQILKHLDSQTQKIDTLIEKENKRIELLKEYRQSLISEVVTGKIDVREEVAV